MSDITIRQATRADKNSFIGLVDAHAAFENMPPLTEEAKDRLLHDGFSDHRLYSAFLASLDGRDVGYAITYEAYSSFLARPVFYLEDIFVYEDARGKGFGGAMFQYLVEEAVDRGCARMEWMVVDWNDNAISRAPAQIPQSRPSRFFGMTAPGSFPLIGDSEVAPFHRLSVTTGPQPLLHLSLFTSHFSLLHTPYSASISS